MERAIKYFKSGTDAKMNVICGLIVITSMVTYKAYEFKCPCIPGFNKPYAFLVLFAPPFIFFFVGVIVSQYCTSLTMEYSRPEGNREKNKRILRSLFIAMMARALAAPILWILVCLLDGQPFVCAFSESLDPEQYGGFADYPEYDTAILQAKIPCKTFDLLRKSSTRKAISRFLKFLSQGIGCISVLTLILLFAVMRVVAPFFSNAASLQLRYWSRYADMEEKYFEEMCILHNHKVAERSIKSYFENRRREGSDEVYGDSRIMGNGENNDEVYSNPRIMGSSAIETLIYVDKWYNCRPPIVGGDSPGQQC